jgi:hypothetical protein
MNFPLYSSLINNISEKDLTILQKNNFVKKISKLDTDTHELFYALIKCYYIEHEKRDVLSIPYSGELSKDKITFDLNQFPNKLKQLLYKFMSIHNKKLEEDVTMAEK